VKTEHQFHTNVFSNPSGVKLLELPVLQNSEYQRHKFPHIIVFFFFENGEVLDIVTSIKISDCQM
jgi:hypothetical protein